MKTTRIRNPMSAALVFAVAFTTTVARAADPLPSWNEGKARQSIVDFVKRVTTKGGKEFVPPAERIAVFGNSDGDLQMPQWTAAGRIP